MECHELDSLERLFQDTPNPFSVQQIIEWMSKLAETLEKVHEKSVRHGDIAPRNLLLASNPDAPTLTLTDFGHSLYLPEPRSTEDKKKFEVDFECFGRLLLQLLTHDLSAKYPLTEQQKAKATRCPQLFELAVNLCEHKILAADTLRKELRKIELLLLNKPVSSTMTDNQNSTTSANETKKIEDASSILMARLKARGFLWENKKILADVKDEDPIQGAIKNTQDSMKLLMNNVVKILLDQGLDPSSEEACIDLQKLIECFRISKWSSQLSADHVRKFMQLVQINSKSQWLTPFDVVLMFAWLGDINLPKSVAIPATLAIDFVHHCVFNNKQIRENFKGFVSRAQIDQDIQKLTFRFADGYLCTSGSFCRNVVLTNKEDTNFPHRLLFAYDQHQNRVIEATDPFRLSYLKACANSAIDQTPTPSQTKVLGAGFFMRPTTVPAYASPGDFKLPVSSNNATAARI